MSHVDVAAAPARDRGFWLHLDLKGAPPKVDYLTSLLTWLRDAMVIYAGLTTYEVANGICSVASRANFVISAYELLMGTHGFLIVGVRSQGGRLVFRAARGSPRRVRGPVSLFRGYHLAEAARIVC